MNNWIIKRKPLDVYYSTSCWLAPHKVGAKSNIASQNLFLFSDLVFDIDENHFSVRNIEKARRETIRLCDIIKEDNITIKYISFSGSKGFHVVCNDPFEVSAESPLQREKETKEYKVAIAKKMLEKGIKIDPKVTVDTRRILRVPGTINSKSGFCCRILTEGELFTSTAREILKKTKNIDISALMIPSGDDKEFHSCKIWGLNRFRARSNPPPYYYSTFLSNKVVSTDLFVPIIEFKKRSESKVIKQLTSIMEIYKLSDAFLFKGDNYFALLPFALQKRRVEKILSAANSANFSSFKKYHQTFTCISDKVDHNLKSFSDKPNFICHIVIDIPKKLVSASHQQFLLDASIISAKYHRIAGSEEYIVRHTLVEN
ncbi:MAG: hypothetical protein ACFFCZ_03475 [Promethearchaeota archaeon]